LTELHRDREWRIANCSSEQVTLRRVKKAFDALFRRCKGSQKPGFPRFKSLKRFPGFGFKGHGDGWRFAPKFIQRDGKPVWQNGTLRRQGVGEIKARGRARQGGKIKSCELLHNTGVWHLSLTIECEDIQRACGTAACGLDWGVETFAMLAFADGTHESIANPRFYQSEKDREVELERIRDRRKRCSKRRLKAAIRSARIGAKNRRRRLDFHHKTSAKLVSRFSLILQNNYTSQT
jgi:putative transposase